MTRFGKGPILSPMHRPRLVALAVAVALLSGLPASAAASTTLPPCRIDDTLTRHRTLSDWPRALLDLEYRLASTHKPGDLRSTADAGLNGGQSVRSFVVADLKAMASAARAAGARFSIQSAYRSYATQKSTFAYWVSVHGWDVAITESARAGHSEHQLGTTIDVKSYGGGAPWDHPEWATTKAGAWMKANAWKYGFVMSYPKGKTSVTCYTYEPWHYRYVGRERAKAMRDSGRTVREFLWREQTAVIGTLTPGGSTRP